MKNSYVYIYGLRDPRNGNVKYVGQTSDMKMRLAMHVAEAKTDKKGNTPKDMWISDLLAVGLIPEMITLEVATTRTCEAAEAKWIKREGQLGELFNRYKAGSRRNVSRNSWVVEFDLPDAEWLRTLARRSGLTVPKYLRQIALSDIAARRVELHS